MRCCLVTRLSCSRAGARLSTRGIDAEGRVAVFAETEQIISILEDGILASFIQVTVVVVVVVVVVVYSAIRSEDRYHCFGNRGVIKRNNTGLVSRGGFIAQLLHSSNISITSFVVMVES